MKLEEVALAWIEMWQLEIEDPVRDSYDWVNDFEYDCVYENPELAIDLVLEILTQDIDTETQEVLAAGPLEQVLGNHGELVIDRVEKLAKDNAEFARLLGGVWQNSMSDEVWKRVQGCWNRAGWDGKQ